MITAEDIDFEQLLEFVINRPDLPDWYGNKEWYSLPELTELVVNKTNVCHLFETNSIIDVLLSLSVETKKTENGLVLIRFR